MGRNRADSRPAGGEFNEGPRADRSDFVEHFEQQLPTKAWRKKFAKVDAWQERSNELTDGIFVPSIGYFNFSGLRLILRFLAI